MEDNRKEDYADESILYELLEYYVRKQDPELSRYKNDAAILPATGTIKNALKYLNNRYSLPECISLEIGLTLPWKFAVGDRGSLLAILQDNLIEIRKSKDEYSSVVGKASVPKDAFPQWRKLAWSPDCSLLVLACSNGYLSFFNSLGNNVFNISPKSLNTNQSSNVLEAGDAVASMIFLKTRVRSPKWAYEFLVINYSGLLKAYYVSATDAFEESHEFSFGSFYRNGVTGVAYNEKHNLLFLAGSNITQNLNTTSSKWGLTSWRIINDVPYYKLSFTNEERDSPTSGFSIWSYLPSLRAQVESVIFKINISPSGEFMACLHTDSSITIWHLPSLRLHKRWELNEQPDFNAKNPLGVVKLRKLPAGLSEFHPMDVDWWSNHSVIIARYCGSVSVCSIKDLRNLLGSSPEFLYGQPQILELCPERGFLSLDCETLLTSKKRSRDSNNESQNSESSAESEKEEDDQEKSTVLQYAGSLLQGALYSITDIEKFQPKRKKSKLVHRTYRILGLKSTTPEELYLRKIEIEEYGEALALAKTYNLDADLVYQTQWRKSEFSLNAIKDHLSKVSKRSWVLNECVTRVPETIEATRELLNFGLRGANLETLLTIGIKDEGKFTPDDTYDDFEDDPDETHTNLRQIQKANQILEKINVNELSEEQKELVKYRRKLLDHLDKLQTYEIILEAPVMYDKNFYEEFRKFSALENTIRFAKDSNYRAVDIMFTYNSAKILPHWLAVLSFFPETLKPSDYEKLLPECDNEGRLFLPDQRELRQKDWSEKSAFDKALGLSDDDGLELIYQCDPTLNAYRNVPLTQELLGRWYKSRAYQIERDSFMVGNALDLIRIGKSRSVTGLENFLFALETLDDLVYKVNMEDMSLAKLEKLTDLDKVKLLMSRSDEESFVDNIKNLVLPFIHRREKLQTEENSLQLLHNYLVSVSLEDLTRPLKFFEYLKQTLNTEIIKDSMDVVKLALDCIYSCNDPKMYEKAKCIFECIPVASGELESGPMYEAIEELEQELECLKTLSKYNVKTTLSYIKNNKKIPETVKLLLIQMARNVNLQPRNEKLWPQLLNDILKLHESTFSCLDIEVCFEICVSARLTSGDKLTIQNCEGLIETKRNEKSLLKVPYKKAVDLILQASTEYFNSSKSLTDSSMELAKACLYLIQDDNPDIKEEYELISSLQILNDFNVNILPLQVRFSQDRIKLIESCLNSQEDGYKSTQRLLTLASYLRVEKYNPRIRDGKVLELIAQKAYQVKDYEVCATTCQRLIDQSSSTAWRIVFDLGNEEDYRDLKFRRKCLSFALNCGPNDLLETIIQRMQLLEIQILHKDLDALFQEQVSENYNVFESEDEFTDAMTTPQVESKEFVPTILGTSTDMVRSSAELVKKSTYSILRNVGNKDFWKNTLNLNFAAQSGDIFQKEDEILKLDALEKSPQSFPCFYESLHSDSSLSNFDTDYTKYSMPDFNENKFKLCQNLVRVALLGESAGYGAEVSNIDHLFVECARHVLTEDCLLGISYLMSLRNIELDFVKSAFEDIPDADLRLQLAAYFYSLELYKKLFPDRSLGYNYDPLELIICMTKAAGEIKEENCKIAQGLIYWSSCLLNSKEFEAESKETEADEVQDTEPEYVLDTRPSALKTAHDKFSAEAMSFESNEEGTGWDDAWGDFSEDSETEEKIPEVNGVEKSDSEFERFESFENLLQNINSEDEYVKAKEKLFAWEQFKKPELTTVDKHPALKMIRIIKEIVEGENERLLECKEILSRQTVAEDVLREFLNDSKSCLDLEMEIFVRLSSDYRSLQEEGVSILKERYQELELSPMTLREIFFKKLTGSFHPNHTVFKEVIQEVSNNFHTKDIKEELISLAEVLIAHSYLPQAAALKNLAYSVPRSLRTFNSGLDSFNR